LTFWVRRNVPESPRWLANRGRFDEARKALHYLQISDVAIERSRIAVQNEPPLPMVPPAVYGDLFKPEMRRRTTHTAIIWLFPLMCSWAMNLWMPKLFVQLYGLTVRQAVGYALYFSLISISARLVVYSLSEKVGRKIPIVIGFSLAGIFLYFAGGAKSATQFFAIACCYQACMEMGLCAIGIYTPEVYPVHIRALGSSWAMGLGRIGGAIGGYAVGAFLGAGHPGMVWVFLGSGSLFAGLITIWMGIEPKGRNLEELNREESAKGVARARAAGAGK
jgi:MFS transporter, putative metabolite:H+ symporter